LLNVGMRLKALSPDASRLEAVTWWRDWMALLMIGSVVMLLILFLIGSADWILIVVSAAAVYGLRQFSDLSRKARKLSQQG
jgi:4-hydroxybenzoate polyprenyltransferase